MYRNKSIVKGQGPWFKVFLKELFLELGFDSPTRMACVTLTLEPVVYWWK